MRIYTYHILILFLFGYSPCYAQTIPAHDSLSKSQRLIDSFAHTFFNNRLSFSKDDLSHLNVDSLSRQKLSAAVSLPDTSGLSGWLPGFKSPSISVFSRPLLQIGSGYISYNWNYRSGIDTPFVEKNISQHLITGSFDATVAQKIPLRITYFQRQSNSSVFRDFTDVRVELNTQELQNMQAAKFRQYLATFTDWLKDPLAKPVMDASLKKIAALDSWLNYSAVKKKLINSKEILMSPELLDTAALDKKEALLQDARDFIALYEKMGIQKKKYEKLYDSVHKVYVSYQKKVQQFQQLIDGNLNNPANLHALQHMAEKYGIEDKRFKKLSAAATSIRTLAIGKTTPNFSNLTLKNTNVKGINFEYNRNKIYMAFATGGIDFRVRDFVYSGQRRVPQMVVAARAGYGRKEANNIIVTYYEGKKQLYPGITSAQSQNIKGVSVSTQLVIGKNHRLNAELAQSAAPVLLNAAGTNEKPSLNFRDHNNQAYSLQLKSYFPATKTKLEGQYMHSGINFQNFSNYRVNASANSWYAKGEQYLWKRYLRVIASLRKNDFSNPLVLQRYKANTIFKNFSATFRDRKWPTISFGYMPSSQYTVIDSLVYENRYQILNASATHQYKIGTARASSAFMFNRFYNDAQDTGFVYYNANNFFFNQSLQFSFYTTSISIAHTESGSYTLDVWDAGLLFKVLKQSSVGCGVKINHINTDTISRVGFYGSASVSIPKIGDLNVWLEKNYLPGLSHQLIRNEFYNIGFTRYFN